LVTKLHYQLRGSRMSGRTAATHGDASPLELLADSAPTHAQLGTDLAQGPTMGVQVGCALNVHRATVTSLSRSERPWSGVSREAVRLSSANSAR
jgi:hypothetical protein